MLLTISQSLLVYNGEYDRLSNGTKPANSTSSGRMMALDPANTIYRPNGH